MKVCGVLEDEADENGTRDEVAVETSVTAPGAFSISSKCWQSRVCSDLTQAAIRSRIGSDVSSYTGSGGDGNRCMR